MKECWINVYDQSFEPLYEFSGKSTSREASIRLADINSTYCRKRLLYRIHVKMKETKPIGRQIPVKPQYINKSCNWWD